MPCRDFPPEEEYHVLANQYKNLTEILCEACHILDDNKLMIFASRDLKIWWKQHEAEDRKRREEIEEQKKLRGIADMVMSTLTPSEKEALREIYGLSTSPKK